MNTAPLNPDTEFIEALPEEIDALLRTEIAAHITATDDSIEIQCWTPEGRAVLAGIRHELESALPIGYQLRILGNRSYAKRDQQRL